MGEQIICHRQAGCEAVFMEAIASPCAAIPGVVHALQLGQAPLGPELAPGTEVLVAVKTPPASAPKPSGMRPGF